MKKESSGHRHGRKVYVARCIGPTGQPIGAYKFGCSWGFEARIQAVASSLPFSLEFVSAFSGGLVMEAACHIHLKEHRISGEYFHENEFVDRFVGEAVKHGSPFQRFEDTGSDDARDAVFEAFREYHRIALEDACAFVGVRPKDYEKSPTRFRRSRKLIAAVGLVASKRGQYARWPNDAISGLLGEHFDDRHTKTKTATTTTQVEAA